MKFLTISSYILALLEISTALPTQKKNVTRIETDPELTAGYFEGDMELESPTRNGMRDENLRWPNNIVFYNIYSNIDTDHRNQILRAINIIEDVSCISFKEVPSDFPYYVNVTSENTGCHSNVGFLNNIQRINLQNFPVDMGCFQLYKIVHEFLHTLGFRHEQSTFNRDEYVQIMEENIQEGRTSAFRKFTEDIVDNFGENYDYASIMHYGPYAFSVNGEKTIVALKEGGEMMGQRISLTQSDINKLNAMYRCPEEN